MASLAERGAQSAVNARNYRADQGFFTTLSIVLSLLIVTGFAQLAIRGYSDPIGAPTRVHVHALLMGSWLGVFSYQNWLAYRGKIALHRKLGWAAMFLVAAIVVANADVTVMAIVDGRMGPGFTPPQFVALGSTDTLSFAGLVAWAIAMRRHTQWHRRLLFGATLVLSAAAFNRLLIPLPDPSHIILSLSGQLAFVGVIAWHDRRVLGHVHKATIAVCVVILVQRFLPDVLAAVPPLAHFANSFAG